MNILETQVSYYKNIRDINSNQTATIGSILRSIECGGKNGAIANQIHQIRTGQDKERRSQLKKNCQLSCGRAYSTVAASLV